MPLIQADHTYIDSLKNSPEGNKAAHEQDISLEYDDAQEGTPLAEPSPILPTLFSSRHIPTHTHP